jgi:hypothetical protein
MLLVCLAEMKSLMLIASLFLVGGCSVNGWGTGVVERHLRNDDAYIIEMTANGIHLSTVPSDAGLTLGHTHRRYYFANPGRVGALSVGETTTTPAHLGSVQPIASSDARVDLQRLGTPLVIVRRETGLVIDANVRRVGLSLGMHTEEWIAIPADQELVMFLQYGEGGAESDRFWVKRRKP